MQGTSKKNWKFGLFYFNKEDQRVFVEKPNPNYGITLNFANPKAYVALLLAALFFGFIVYMITKKAS
ncbi:DUF5808 domain-containing protein [Flavobacterium terrisoli]|uniref:DUF5808 domain-containing protein n=1 Tax=Flavobacterium terrisoli TaxID=3242195 RepID=UPI0025438515|nr:DUF5808 domain-containing protein [Flavobacterium buctense]